MAKVSEHTPGPWKVDECYTGIFVTTAGGQNVAQVTQSEVDWKYPASANARLIAAAPDLLRLLKDVVRCDKKHSDLLYEDPDFRKEIEAVIAKAEGK